VERHIAEAVSHKQIDHVIAIRQALALVPSHGHSAVQIVCPQVRSGLADVGGVLVQAVDEAVVASAHRCRGFTITAVQMNDDAALKVAALSSSSAVTESD
jgi:hypothetical protein